MWSPTWPLTTCQRFNHRPKCWSSAAWRPSLLPRWQTCSMNPNVKRRGLKKKTALNRRQCKNRVAFAKVHSLWKGWTVEKWQKTFFFFFFDESSIELHSHYHKYCRRPVGTCRDPRFIQKTVKFGGGKIMVGVTSSMWMCERSVKWMATSTAWSIKFLLPITPPERANSSAGWRSFSYFSLHIKIPESEGQGAPGLASPVTRHKHYWACLG